MILRQMLIEAQVFLSILQIKFHYKQYHKKRSMPLNSKDFQELEEGPLYEATQLP